MKAKDRYFKNRNMLINYVEQSNNSELQQFVDTLLMLEVWNENRPKAKLTISIGKAEYKNGEFYRFFPNLDSRTNDPTVFVDSYKNDPLIAIWDRQYCNNDTIAMFNLTDITDLNIKECINSETATYLFCTFHAVHINLDYMIILRITK